MELPSTPKGVGFLLDNSIGSNLDSRGVATTWLLSVKRVPDVHGGGGGNCASSSPLPLCFPSMVFRLGVDGHFLGNAKVTSRLIPAMGSGMRQQFEDGRYREALGKWEAALTIMPEKAVVHEQKAQVLLEIGDAWSALKAATRATELEPTWAEAWLTLGRAQLNFGEPDLSLESFDKALAIKPDLEDARADRETALQLIKRRKHLHSSNAVSTTETRFKLQEKPEVS